MSQSNQIKTPWSQWHDRLHKTLKAQGNLIPKGACLLLSVSGGQDSMVLLKLIIDLQKFYNWKIQVWHGNHSWHNKSDQISRELNRWCKEHNLDFYCDIAAKSEVETEESARNWRYNNLIKHSQLLTKLKPTCPCKYILTGHTSTDRTETHLINLARGSHLKGLSSLRKTRELSKEIILVRPLLDFTRTETAKICQEFNLPIWNDPSNQDNNFSRNKIRNKVIPILENLYPGSSKRIAMLSEKLTYFADDYQELASFALESAKSVDGLSREKLYQLSHSARSSLLAKWLEENGVPNIRALLLEEISRSIAKAKPPGSRNLPKGWIIKWTRKSIKLLNSKLTNC